MLARSMWEYVSLVGHCELGLLSFMFTEYYIALFSGWICKNKARFWYAVVSVLQAKGWCKSNRQPQGIDFLQQP